MMTKIAVPLSVVTWTSSFSVWAVPAAPRQGRPTGLMGTPPRRFHLALPRVRDIIVSQNIITLSGLFIYVTLRKMIVLRDNNYTWK